MKIFFNIRVFLWSIVFELENFLYPYKNREPEIDYYYIIKNDATGEEYSVVDWIKNFDKRLEKMEDNFLYFSSELNKVNKLDLEVMNFKKIIYENKNEKN